MSSAPASTAGLIIALRKLNGDNLRLHGNPFARSLKRLNVDSSSFLIRSAPGELFEVLVQFTDQFELGAARGVCITIAIGHEKQDPSNVRDTQSFWIDEHNLRKEHSFSSILKWTSEASTAATTEFSMPQLDFVPSRTCENVLWQEPVIANEGCIAVFVTRGNLKMKWTQPRQFRETDPPSLHQYTRTSMPKIIHPEWFKADDDIVDGRVVIKEFRNLYDIFAGNMAFGAGYADTAWRTSQSFPYQEFQHRHHSTFNSAPATHSTSTTATVIHGETTSGRRSTPIHPNSGSNDLRGLSHTARAHGAVQPFWISTKTKKSPPGHDHAIAGPGNTSSVRQPGLGHILSEDRGAAIDSNTVSPNARAAAAARKRHVEAKKKQTISQQRLKSAHSRKRTATVGDSLGRECVDGGVTAKRSKREQDGSAQSNVRVPARRSVQYVDLTEESEDEVLVKVEVEALEESASASLEKRSTQDLEDELREVQLRRALRARKANNLGLGNTEAVTQAEVKRE